MSAKAFSEYERYCDCVWYDDELSLPNAGELDEVK